MNGTNNCICRALKVIKMSGLDGICIIDDDEKRGDKVLDVWCGCGKELF